MLGLKMHANFAPKKRHLVDIIHHVDDRWFVASIHVVFCQYRFVRKRYKPHFLLLTPGLSEIGPRTVDLHGATYPKNYIEDQYLDYHSFSISFYLFIN